MMKAAFHSSTAAAAALTTALALALTCSVAVAAPQDPARVDGAHGHDPAAVSAASPPHEASRDGGLLSADAWQRIVPRTSDRDRQAHAAVRSPSTYPSSASGRQSGWLDQLLSPDDAAPRQDMRLQQGVRAAQGAMDEMGRQLMPALRELQRDFDEGLEQAQSR